MGGGGGVGLDPGVCEQRIEVFVKIQKKKNIQKNKNWWGRVGGSGWM